MNVNLLELINASIGPQLVQHTGAYLGEDQNAVQTAVSAALPGLLGGIVRKATAPGGTPLMLGMMNHGALDARALGDVASLLSSSERTESTMQLGQQFLGALFGDRASSFASALSALSGIQLSAATRLLGLAAPMVIGFLKDHMNSAQLSVDGLVGLLAGQSGFLKSTLNERVSAVLGLDAIEVAPAAASTAAPASPPPATSVGRWLPWLVVVFAAIIFLPQLRSCGTGKVNAAKPAAAVTK